MAKNSITDYSKTAASNTDIQSVDIAEGCLPSGINNAIRGIMADLADMNDGTVTLTSPSFAAATITGDLTVDTNTLKVDSTNNRVGIGTSSPAYNLDVQSGSDPAQIRLKEDGNTNGFIIKNYDGDEAQLVNADNGPMVFKTNNLERMRIDSSGNIGIGTSSPDRAIKIHKDNAYVWIADAAGGNVAFIGGGGENDGRMRLYDRTHTAKVDIQSEDNSYFNGGNVGIGTSSPNTPLHVIGTAGGSTYAVRVHHDGNSTGCRGLEILSGTDNNSSTNPHIDFRDGDGTFVGRISSSNGTVTYGAFTAMHPCILPDADNDTGYPYGTLLETTSLSYTQKNDADTERGLIYNVRKTQSANSKAVLGAYGSKEDATEEEASTHQVLVLGDGHILCNNSGGNISMGDGICSSAVAGIGQKATANPSMIIGIAQEDVTFTDDAETKLVAVQYGLQQFVPWS